MMKNDENDNLVFTVNYNILLQTGISINQFLFLQLLNKGDINLYKFYLEQFKSPVDVNDLKYLLEKDLLITKDGTLRYTFENLKVSALFLTIFEKRVENAIEELQNTYPKKTPLKERRLQSDPDKWKKTYLSIIKGKPELHNTIIKCIKAEIQHRKQSGNEEFYPLLTTYLNNRRWEDYEDSIGEYTEESKFERLI